MPANLPTSTTHESQEPTTKAWLLLLSLLAVLLTLGHQLQSNAAKLPFQAVAPAPRTTAPLRRVALERATTLHNSAVNAEFVPSAAL